MLFAICLITKENRLVWPRLWAIRLARLPKRSAGRGRRSRASSRATSCRAGAIRRFTPPEPINCAGGVKRGSKEIEPYGPSLSTGSRKGGPRSKFQAGSRAETNLACGPWVARRSTPSSTGQRNRPSSYGVTSRAITNAAARADRDLRKIPSRIASPSTNGPKHVEARTEGGHWEGDLIICKRTRPVLVLHERKSRVTLAARLPGRPPPRPFRLCWRCSLGSTRRCASPSPSTMIPPSPSTPCCEPGAP